MKLQNENNAAKYYCCSVCFGDCISYNLHTL